MKLRQVAPNKYYITDRKVFIGNQIDEQIMEKCFRFAYSMVFGTGHHRKHRSGGQHKRKNGELFANTFQGKLAEFIVYEELKKNGVENLALPDTNIYGKGIWDDFDLEVSGKKINIKSVAFFSNLLLLEAADWSCEDGYISGGESLRGQKYDYFVVVRIKPDVKNLFQSNDIFYANDIEKEKLQHLIFSEQWFFDIAGVCTEKTIQYIIKNDYFLPQNSLLNDTVRMDADNYYIQVGNLKDFSFFVQRIKKMLP